MNYWTIKYKIYLYISFTFIESWKFNAFNQVTIDLYNMYWTFVVADNPNVYHQKWEVCQCTTKFDHGCVLDTCEYVCVKIDYTIAAYCSDKSTCICVYRCWELWRNFTSSPCICEIIFQYNPISNVYVGYDLFLFECWKLIFLNRSFVL